MWNNFSFPCMTIVGKLKISPHVEKFQMSPHVEKSETLHIWVSFCRTGILVVLCLIFFFKQKATVAKPMDFDDFYRFVLTNHDLFMVRK